MRIKGDSVFDHPYTLPSITNSIGIALRSPSSNFTQSFKYVPNYGGLLDVPGVQINEYGLQSGLPFQPIPDYMRIISSGAPEQENGPVPVTECMAMTSMCDETKFVTVTALEKVLYFNSFSKIDETETPKLFESFQFAHVPYPYKISGLKADNDYVLVKFNQGLKLIKFNENYRQRNHSSPLFFISSFPVVRGYELKDACFSGVNVHTATCRGEDLQIRIYDITRSKPIHVSDKTLQTTGGAADNVVRRTRAFKPMKTQLEEVVQLDNNPWHIFNKLLVTTQRVLSVDPRADKVYVDQSKFITLPTEVIKRLAYSNFNEHQFYSLTNFNLRVFDTRYLSNPINCINHMLADSPYDGMDMRCLQLDDDRDLICASQYGKLAFMTFKQSPASDDSFIGALITPSSTHQVFHELSPPFDLVGLALTKLNMFSDKRHLFSALQLSREGDVCVRGYKAKTDDNEHQQQKFETLNSIQSVFKDTHRKQVPKRRVNKDMVERDVLPSSNKNRAAAKPPLIDPLKVTVPYDKLKSERGKSKLRLLELKLRMRCDDPKLLVEWHARTRAARHADRR